MNGPTVVQGRICQRHPGFHMLTGTPSQHQAHLGPSLTASPVWENEAAHPIPALPLLPNAGPCHPARLEQAGTTLQQCNHPNAPCKMSPCYWEIKAMLISRCLCVTGPAPKRCIGSQAACPTSYGRSAPNAITYQREEVARLGDASQYPEKYCTGGIRPLC